MGHPPLTDDVALGRLLQCLLQSANRLCPGSSLAFRKAAEIHGTSFSAILESIPDYEHAAILCADVDPLTDPIKADVLGQEGGRDAVRVRLQSVEGTKCECYITLYLDHAAQRIGKTRTLNKLKGGYLDDRELRANVTIDNRPSSPRDLSNFFEGAALEPVNLELIPEKVGRAKGSKWPDQSEARVIGRSQSLKPPEPLPFAELYALCEENIPPRLQIRGFPFSRNLQKFSSSGRELNVGEAGKETDVVRISYAVPVHGEAAEVASEMVCAADGIPDFPQILQDIERTIEAVISSEPREIHRIDLAPNMRPRIIPFESTAPRADVVREGSRPNNQQSVQMDQGLPHPAHIFTTGVVRRSRAIYWSPNQPPEDVKAQIILALIQFRLLREPSPFVRWLEGYILQNFKIMIPSEDRKTAVIDAVSRLLDHHGLTEDFKSWRKYVHFYLDRVARDLGSSALNPEDVPDPRGDSSDEESMDDSAARVGAWSVADCARELGVSWQWANSLIRKLVREGKLIPLQTNPMRIAESHVGMLVRGRKRRVREQRSRLRKRKNLERQGKSFETARRAINRKRGRSPTIFESKDKSES